MFGNRLRILSPLAGAELDRTLTTIPLTVHVCLDSSCWHYDTETLVGLNDLFKVYLFDSDGKVIPQTVDPVVTPIANSDDVSIKVTVAANTFPDVRPLNTILVCLYGLRGTDFSRITVTARSHGPIVQIATPPAGSGVTYPFTASGTATGGLPPSVSGRITYGVHGANSVTGNVIQQGSPWAIQFDSGPSGMCSLTVTDNANSVSTSESLSGLSGL